MEHVRKPTFTVETITPTEARAILEGNTRNRKANPRHIAKLALEMTNGTWAMDGTPIRIAVDGTLIDGQHRLLACIKADVPFTTLVMTDADIETMRIIDGGKSRSHQQQLQIADGILPEATNIVKMLCRFSMGPHYDTELTTDVIRQVVEKHPAITETATAYKDATLFGLGANLPAAELILRAHGYQDEAQAWRNVWVHGAASDLGQTAFYFREALIRDNAREHGKKWSHVFRRKLVATALLRTFAGLGAMQWRATTTLFKETDATSLQTTTDFEKTQKTISARITATPDKISTVKHDAKRLPTRRIYRETDAKTLPGTSV